MVVYPPPPIKIGKAAQLYAFSSGSRAPEVERGL
jgi:hypothetical protein